MKDKAKNALKHKVEVAGKTIPTMVIIGLFLVGGGSAALLSSFGTVSGDANVQQAVTIEGASDNVLTANSYDKEITAGQTVTDVFTVSNDADIAAEVSFDSNATDVSGVDQTVYRANTVMNELTLDRSGTPNEGQNDKSDWDGLDGDIGYEGAVNYQFIDGLNTLQVQVEKVNYSDSNDASAILVIDEDQDGNSDYQVANYPETWSIMDADGSNERPVSEVEGVDVAIEDVDSDGITEHVVNISRDRFGTSLDLAVTTEEDSSAVEARYPSPGDFAWTDSTDYKEISLKKSEVTATASVPSDGSSSFVAETKFAINLVGQHTVGMDVVPTGTDVDDEQVQTPS